VSVLAAPGTWVLQAQCVDYDPEGWFPEGKGDDPRPAKEVCAACPVRTDCLQYALDNGLDEGIWGGMTATERGALKARQTG
jgi:WhiB family redox-sensing transcriptional regulator